MNDDMAQHLLDKLQLMTSQLGYLTEAVGQLTDALKDDGDDPPRIKSVHAR